MVGFGKRVPCNIYTFIDDLSRGDEMQVFVTEILDKNCADDIVEQRRATGIVEVKKSRSRDIFLRRGDLVHVQIDGQMRVTESMTDDQHTICFLPGSSTTFCLEIIYIIYLIYYKLIINFQNISKIVLAGFACTITLLL